MSEAAWPTTAETARSVPPELLARAQTRLRRGPYVVWVFRWPAICFDEGEQRLMLEMIIALSSESFGGDMRAYWESRPRYFAEVHEWWLATQGGRVVGWHGFRCWATADGQLIYYDSLNIMAEARRTGLGSVLTVEPFLRACLRQRRLVCVSMRTESAVVYRMLQRFAGNWTYPRIGHRRPSVERARRLAAYAAIQLGSPQPDPLTFRVAGALADAGELYGGPPPSSGDAAIDAFFRQHVDPARGDALLSVGVAKPLRSLVIALAYLVIRGQLAVAARQGGR